MRTPEFIKRCLAAGMPLEMALTAAKAFEAECEIALTELLETRRSKERERQAKHRAKKNAGHVMSRDVTLEPVTRRDLTCERAQVVVLSSSSLRSEEGKEPTSSNEDVPPLRVAKPNGFARFWEAYPNKVGKAAAEAAYAKALRRVSGPDPPAVLLAGVERAKASRAWADGYIPHPTTWLRQGRWEDEPAEVNPQPRKADERPHHDAKFAARQANLARAFAGSESAALRRR